MLCAPPRARISPWVRARARRRGGAARSQRSQGWETCPGYLPNYTWLFWRAPSRGFHSGQSEEYDPSLKRDDWGRHFLFCLIDLLYLPKEKHSLGQVVVTITAVAEGKVFQWVFLLFGCSCRKLQVVNRFLVRARAQSTAGSQQSSLSTDWESQKAKIRA